jgi:hypothetical protein
MTPDQEQPAGAAAPELSDLDIDSLIERHVGGSEITDDEHMSMVTFAQTVIAADRAARSGSADARDAARYRFIRDADRSDDKIPDVLLYTMDSLDAYIDAAMKESPVSTQSPAAQAGSPQERDTTKPAEQQGLFRKFDVRRTDGSDAPGGKHHGCEYFVLDVRHDPHAKAALAAYAEAVRATHPLLADDMIARYGLAAQPVEHGHALREAAQAVVDRWDTPKWKDAPHTAEYINRLRRELAAAQAAHSAPVAWRPIKTAPKDGLDMLLLVPGPRGWTVLHGRWLGDYWIGFNADRAVQRIEPTHWADLLPHPAPQTSRPDEPDARAKE